MEPTGVNADAAAVRMDELEGLRPALRRSAAALLHDDHDVEDAVQEAIFRLIRYAQRCRLERNTLSRLGSMTVRRVALDMLALKTRLNQTNSDAIAEWPGDTPAAPIETAHVRGRLRDAVDALPEPQRVAFLLVFHEGLSHSQAAEELRISAETLRARLFRARCRLRSALKDLQP